MSVGGVLGIGDGSGLGVVWVDFGYLWDIAGCVCVFKRESERIVVEECDIYFDYLFKLFFSDLNYGVFFLK